MTTKTLAFPKWDLMDIEDSKKDKKKGEKLHGPLGIKNELVEPSKKLQTDGEYAHNEPEELVKTDQNRDGIIYRWTEKEREREKFSLFVLPLWPDNIASCTMTFG